MNYHIILDRNITIYREGLTNLGTFAPVNSGCSIVPDDNIARLEVDEDSIVQIHLGQYSDALAVIEEHKDNPLFAIETDIYFFAYDGFSDKLIDDFEGDWIDALLFVYNNGEKYERV